MQYSESTMVVRGSKTESRAAPNAARSSRVTKGCGLPEAHCIALRRLLYVSALDMCDVMVLLR